LSARIALTGSLVSNASASPRFQQVVWEWDGKLGCPPSLSSGTLVQLGEAAAGFG
jgi:hypothetical protein